MRLTKKKTYYGYIESFLTFEPDLIDSMYKVCNEHI